MLKSNSTLRREARLSLDGKWMKSILVVLIYSVILGVTCTIPGVGFITSIFLTWPLLYGLMIVFLKHSRGDDFRIEDLFAGFRNYTNVLTTLALQNIYVYLWSLLLIIPGVIKTYSYAMTPYILNDRGLTNNEAIEESMRMMSGHKMRLFLLDFVYFLLTVVLVITIIGWLWVLPKWYTARANFYNDLLKLEADLLPTQTEE